MHDKPSMQVSASLPQEKPSYGKRVHEKPSHRVVIVGGGFGGLYAAQSLKHTPVHITLVDKRNFHLFQPLLYQVASGALSPGDIASPLREILHAQRNIDIFLDEVIDIDPASQIVILRDGSLHYDTLVMAAGGVDQYFGHDDWKKKAPSLKSLEDALTIRRKILLAFESAEKETDPALKSAYLTFVIIGGGPTGVELAGTLAELARKTIRDEFRHIDFAEIRIFIVEAGETILAVYPPDLIAKATKGLSDLGVSIYTQHMVKALDDDRVTMTHAGEEVTIQSKTVLWTAGVKPSGLAKVLADKVGVVLDKSGRIPVVPDCTLPDHPEIFVIGDLANYSHQTGKPLPGLAAVAIQQGRYVGHVISHRLKNKTTKPFHYRDKGNLTIIGRHAAVAELGRLHLSGFPAWMIWLFVHIFYLIGFENKILVLFQWAWNYWTQGRSACLITEQSI
jgi:NADH dehydrogenase